MSASVADSAPADDGTNTLTWDDVSPGCTFTGDIGAGSLDGAGTYRWGPSSVYVGDVAGGMRSGNGKQTHSDIAVDGDRVTSTYTGTWLDGRRHGKGRLTVGNAVYAGEWAHGRRHGKGRQKYGSGNTYDGDWVADLKHGYGVMTWSTTNEVYEGEWRNDEPHGVGTHTWSKISGADAVSKTSTADAMPHLQTCNQYRGEFVAGARHGQGTFTYANGAVYTGEWRNNAKHGHGTLILDNGRVITGVWVDDQVQEGSRDRAQGGEGDDEGAVTPPPPPPGGAYQELVVDCSDLCARPQPTSLFSQTEMITTVLLRYHGDLRRIYYEYARWPNLGQPGLHMTLRQLWAWARDCAIRSPRLSRADISRIAMHRRVDDRFRQLSAHDGGNPVFLREFYEVLVRVSARLFPAEADESLAQSLEALIQTVVLERCNSSSALRASGGHDDKNAEWRTALVAPVIPVLKTWFDRHVTLPEGETVPAKAVMRVVRSQGVPVERIVDAVRATYGWGHNPASASVVDIVADELVLDETVEIVARCVPGDVPEQVPTSEFLASLAKAFQGSC
ncbi:unnamed protein product (mitochondrion) [Plasmodiophora brassicae]|uniref:Uncharacterized protein n=1 Tax=Plasmodiophora brassicae TaxID=37360 RepID=A0A3P3XZ51_PLABS|nr:unnamed protein product [Plasmodiophora brassicae]